MPASSQIDFDRTKPLLGPIFRGNRQLRIALVGLPNSGKSTIFQAVSSTSIHTGKLSGTQKFYAECAVRIDMDEIHLVDLPSLSTLCDLEHDDLEALKYLLWGDSRPLIYRHEQSEPPAPFSRPDVLVHVIDSSALDRALELTLELADLGLPMVLALNMMDEAHRKGVNIDVEDLSRKLGIPVVPTIAFKGHGIAELFSQAADAARSETCPLPQPSEAHIAEVALRFGKSLSSYPEILEAFRVPLAFLDKQLMQGDINFSQELKSHFPLAVSVIDRLRSEAEEILPRPLAEELEADRHHRATSLFESVASLASRPVHLSWNERLDAIFLHPRWGMIGSLAIFACVLFMVFEVSATLDALSSARLTVWAEAWQPDTTAGVIGHAVVDGLIGLIGIVIPYMLPLVLMLVALEESGIMQRIAFVVDRFFHRIGLHGKVAVTFLLGLGCNVPAIASTRTIPERRDRIVASLLITFVPCSARSAIILALGGKYLGGFGVFGIFILNLVIIAILGRLLTRRYPEISPGLIQEIPPYAIPQWKPLLKATWSRSRDILTIVTPLLVGGSIVLALLHHMGADAWINTLLSPVTYWMLGLPVALGVPILFGVLRKELSLLMVYQALGTFEIGPLLDWVQITTFLIFLTFYIPCISTFAVMLKVIGLREALFSIALSIGVALIISLAVRLLLQTVNLFV